MTQILRLPEVKARTGLSRTSIYLKIKAGEFPRPVSLGTRAVGWLDTAIDEWVAGCARRGHQPAPIPPAAIANSRTARRAKAEARAA